MKLETKIKQLETERAELFRQKEPIDNRLIEIYDELQPLYEKRGKKEVKALKGKLDFELMLMPETGSMAKHREAERQVQSLGLWRSGYYAATMQSCIEVMLSPTNLQQTYDSVMLMLPYIKPFPDVTPDGNEVPEYFKNKKILGIFEHNLSKYAVYQFAISEDGTSEIIATRYGHTSVHFTAPTIMDGLKYIQKNLPYETDEKDEF